MWIIFNCIFFFKNMYILINSSHKMLKKYRKYIPSCCCCEVSANGCCGSIANCCCCRCIICIKIYKILLLDQLPDKSTLRPYAPQRVARSQHKYKSTVCSNKHAIKSAIILQNCNKIFSNS